MVTWPSPRGRPPRPLHSCPPLRTALPTRSPKLTNSTSRQFRALPNRLSTSRALWQVSSRNTGRPYRSRTAGRTDSEGHICSPPGRQGRSAAKPMARTPAVPDSILSNSLRAVSRRTASGASFGRSVPARRNTRRSSPHRTLSQRPGRNATPAAFGASGESRRRTGFRPGSSLHTTSLSRRTSPSIISPTILEMVILLKPVLTTRSRRVRHAPVATMRRTNPRLSRLLSPLFFPAFSSMTCPFPRCLSNLPCRSSPPAFFICLLYDAPRGPSRKTAPPPGGAV